MALRIVPDTHLIDSAIIDIILATRPIQPVITSTKHLFSQDADATLPPLIRALFPHITRLHEHKPLSAPPCQLGSVNSSNVMEKRTIWESRSNSFTTNVVSYWDDSLVRTGSMNCCCHGKNNRRIPAACDLRGCRPHRTASIEFGVQAVDKMFKQFSPTPLESAVCFSIYYITNLPPVVCGRFVVLLIFSSYSPTPSLQMRRKKSSEDLEEHTRHQNMREGASKQNPEIPCTSSRN